MRLFYASFLSFENMHAYDSLVAGVDGDVPNALRSIPHGTHHLTLAFIGEVAENDVGRCLEVLDFAKEFPVIHFSLDRPRILYSRRSPRLVCAGLSAGSERVSMLQKQLLSEFLERFPESDVRVKPPHVTLARFKKRANREAAQKVAEALSGRDGPSPDKTDSLTRVQLVKSVLTRTGPVYESLGESRLSGAENSGGGPE
jgi:2'-5' RNA ligase